MTPSGSSESLGTRVSELFKIRDSVYRNSVVSDLASKGLIRVEVDSVFCVT